MNKTDSGGAGKPAVREADSDAMVCLCRLGEGTDSTVPVCLCRPGVCTVPFSVTFIDKKSEKLLDITKRRSYDV